MAHTFGSNTNSQGGYIVPNTAAGNYNRVYLNGVELNDVKFTGITTTVDSNTMTFPVATRCAKEGHVMFHETELATDGSVHGMCEVCGELITGRRLPGGFALLQLREALERALDGDTEVIAGEFLRLAEIVDAEEKALSEAKSLLRLAERALLSRLDRQQQ